ncbi:hypothetical protein ACFL03_03035 [Thermodesulfobacteriota bacterium]
MPKEIIFVKTRYVYDSYSDFWQLVKLSGYKTCYVDEVFINKEDTVFITAPINGEWRPHIDNQRNLPHNAHLVLWQLERPANSGGSIGQYGKDNRDLIYNRYFDEVWISDQQLANESMLRFVPLGSHPNLGHPGPLGNKHFNAVHMSYIVPRRATIYKKIKKLAPNCWGDRRDQVLKQSKCGINVHQDNYPFCEPLRLALFAAYGLPVISERVTITEPYGGKIIWQDYEDVIPTMKNALSDYAKLYEFGLELRNYLCEKNNFKKWVDKAIFEEGVWK